jgi:hypothetical protein
MFARPSLLLFYLINYFSIYKIRKILNSYNIFICLQTKFSFLEVRAKTVTNYIAHL